MRKLKLNASNRVLIALSVMLLASCRVSQVELDLTGEDLMAAANGEVVFVDFEAEVGNEYTNLDDQQRAELKQVVALVEDSFPDAETELDFGDSGFRIRVEGQLKVSTQVPDAGSPFYVDVMTAVENRTGAVLVSLKPSKTIESFNEKLRALNFMYSADDFQPAKFKFKASNGLVITGGAYIDGEPSTLRFIEMAGQRVTMMYDGGIWEKTAPGFIFIPTP